MTNPVIIIASEEALGDELRRLAITVSGVFALTVIKKNYAVITNNVPLGTRLKIQIGTPLIFVSQEVADLLSDEYAAERRGAHNLIGAIDKLLTRFCDFYYNILKRFAK